MSDSWNKFRELQRKRLMVLEKLVPCAKAAANQMADAGMAKGAAPLQEVLFELEALDQELSALIRAEPKAMVDGLIKAMKRDG